MPEATSIPKAFLFKRRRWQCMVFGFILHAIGGAIFSIGEQALSEKIDGACSGWVCLRQISAHIDRHVLFFAWTILVSFETNMPRSILSFLFSYFAGNLMLCFGFIFLESKEYYDWVRSLWDYCEIQQNSPHCADWCSETSFSKYSDREPAFWMLVVIVGAFFRCLFCSYLMWYVASVKKCQKLEKQSTSEVQTETKPKAN